MNSFFCKIPSYFWLFINLVWELKSNTALGSLKPVQNFYKPKNKCLTQSYQDHRKLYHSDYKLEQKKPAKSETEPAFVMFNFMP